MYQVSKKSKHISTFLLVLGKIAECWEADGGFNFIRVRKLDDENILLEATDNKRALQLRTSLIKLEEGLYQLTKSKDTVCLIRQDNTICRFPDIDRIIVKQPSYQFKIAACVSAHSSIYPILINKSSFDNTFKFVNSGYIDDFIKLVDESYREVTMKTNQFQHSSVQLEFKNSVFEVIYIVAPMETAVNDIIQEI